MSSALSLETKPIPMRIEARRKFLEGLSSSPTSSSPPPPPSSPSSFLPLSSSFNMDNKSPVVSYSKKSTQESKEYYKSDTLEASREIRTTEQESFERGSPKFFHHHQKSLLSERSSSDVDVVDSAPTTHFINYSSSPSVNLDRFSKTTTTSRLHGSNPSIVTEQFQQRANGTLTSSSGIGRSYFTNNSDRSSPTPVMRNGGPTEKLEYNIRIEKSPDILRGSEEAASSPVSPGNARRKEDQEDASVEVVELQLHKELEYEPRSGAGPDTRKYPPLEPQLLLQSEFTKGNKTSYDFVPVVESKKEKKARKKRETKQDQSVQKKSFGDSFFDAIVFCSDCLTCYGKAD